MSGAAVSGQPSAREPYYQDLYVLGALSGCAVLLAAATFPWWGGGWRVLCPFNEITGIPCPTCYGTRAMLALMAGDWRDALRLNPLVAALGFALFAYVPWSIATVLGGWRRPRVPLAWVAKAGWAGAFVAVANWAYLVIVHA